MVEVNFVAAGMVPTSKNDDGTGIDAPTTDIWTDNISGIYLASLIAGFVIAIVVLIITFFQIRRIHKYVRDENVQLDLYWVILYPFFVCLNCAVRNLVPRAAIVLYAVSYTYTLLAYLAVFTGTLKAFGGMESVAQYLSSANKDISLRTKPCCNCCICLPSLRPSKRNWLRLLKVVSGVPVIRIIILVGLLVAEVDGIRYSGAQAFSAIADASVILTLYTMHIQYAVLYDRMRPYGLNVYFQVVDGTMPFLLLGKAILEQLGSRGVFKDTEVMPAISIAYFWFNAGMPFIMLIASVAALICLRLSQAEIFDVNNEVQSLSVRLSDVNKRTTSAHY